MTETRWWTYLQGLMGAQTQQEAAEKIGISKSNITRWKAGARADPEFVVKVARAYNANVLEALVEADFITEQEAALTEVSPRLDLTKIPGADLMSEVERRLEELRFLASLSPERDDLAARRGNPPVSTPDTDDEEAIAEANQFRGAAQHRTPRLDEPENP